MLAVNFNYAELSTFSTADTDFATENLRIAVFSVSFRTTFIIK